MKKLRFRQVHLDFHTSPLIPNVGAAFDKREWQEKLTAARVDSITCFATCHHGMSYYPTKVGTMHPHLSFNLLRAQIDASKEIDIKVPVYVTAGLNNEVARRHPEWREIDADGTYAGWTKSPLEPGFMKLCFNTPYLDWLCELIAETVREFPDGDGIFLDITTQGPCCCPWCLESMAKLGLDPKNPADRLAHAKRVLSNYRRRAAETIRAIAPDMPVFHNGGHIAIGDREDLGCYSHLELESLPTADWGYDHYPISAAYSRNLGLDFLGMTGKFHMAWGEFGTFKHPNALRYECAAMLLHGSKCSVGDQLHPSGKLDDTTYRLIGEAYREVETKEPWCRNAESAAATAIIAVDETPENQANTTGAARVLLETHVPFDIVDSGMDFSKYRMLILATGAPVTPELAAKLKTYLAAGGKLIVTAKGALTVGNGDAYLPVGGEFGETSPFCPDFVETAPEFTAFATTPFAMRLPSVRFKAKEGVSLGRVYDPYFNRDVKHFCSHQFTPYRPEPSGYDAGALAGNVLYFSHPVFAVYCLTGMGAVRDFIACGFDRLCGADRQVISDGLPSTGRVGLMRQKKENRHVFHVLYGNTVLRGRCGSFPNGQFPAKPVEVVEELLPLRNVSFSLAIPGEVHKLTLVPEGKTVDFRREGERVCFTLDEFTCHAMVAID